MIERHYKILSYLKSKEDSALLNEFPNAITSDFIPGSREGSLVHELEIVLSYNKKWIKRGTNVTRSYLITQEGIDALEIENNKIKSILDKAAVSDEKESLEMQKLRSENVILVNQLVDYGKEKKDKRILLFIAIAEFLALLVLGILQLVKK